MFSCQFVLRNFKKYTYIVIINNMGKIIKNKLCTKFVLINFEDSSKKIIDKNPNK